MEVTADDGGGNRGGDCFGFDAGGRVVGGEGVGDGAQNRCGKVASALRQDTLSFWQPSISAQHTYQGTICQRHHFHKSPFSSSMSHYSVAPNITSMTANIAVWAENTSSSQPVHLRDFWMVVLYVCALQVRHSSDSIFHRRKMPRRQNVDENAL